MKLTVSNFVNGLTNYVSPGRNLLRAHTFIKGVQDAAVALTVFWASDSVKSEAELATLSNPIITLTTDYGTGDHLAGVLRGVILKILPSATVVDISHHVVPMDVLGRGADYRQRVQVFSAADGAPGGGGPGSGHAAASDPGERRSAFFRGAG